MWHLPVLRIEVHVALFAVEIAPAGLKWPAMWPTSQVQILPERLRTHGLPERCADKGDRCKARWLCQRNEHGLKQLVGQCQ